MIINDPTCIQRTNLSQCSRLGSQSSLKSHTLGGLRAGPGHIHFGPGHQNSNNGPPALTTFTSGIDLRVPCINEHRENHMRKGQTTYDLVFAFKRSSNAPNKVSECLMSHPITRTRTSFQRAFPSDANTSGTKLQPRCLVVQLRAYRSPAADERSGHCLVHGNVGRHTSRDPCLPVRRLIRDRSGADMSPSRRGSSGPVPSPRRRLQK